MAFAQKKLDVTFTLASGGKVTTFPTTGTNTAKASGLRAMAKIVNAGGFSMESLELRVFGLDPSTMNALATLGLYPLVATNSVTVEASDDNGGMNLVFQGTINAAYGDYNAQPDVSFVVQASSTMVQAVKTIESQSFLGQIDVASVLQQLAGTMGFTFENHGVSVQLWKPVLTGSALDQARQLIEAAGIQAVIEKKTLAIWPTGQSRAGDAVPISPDTGLIGYPTFAAAGVVLRTVYNARIKNGGLLQVQSSLQPACGQWVAIKIDHDLQANVPHGLWETTILASKFGLPGQAP